MGQHSLEIRAAQPDDAERVALLLYSAYTHIPVSYPPQEVHEGGWIEHLERYISQEDNRFSYRHIQVAELDTQVVGAILSFGGRDEPQLNAVIGTWLEREAREDEWYIDALAVFSNWGKQGVGTRLLQRAEQQALEYHYTKTALNVAQENKEALALYIHRNYVPVGETTLYQRPHIRMVKVMENEDLRIHIPPS